jgi:hypothetical protein
VANLSLLAATSNALSVSGSEASTSSLMVLTAMLSLTSLVLGLGFAYSRDTPLPSLDQLIHPVVPIVRSLAPPCRPGF